MSLFDNCESEDFLLLAHNFKAGAKNQYLRTITRGEALCQFDSFSADVESTQILNFEDTIKG